MSYYTTYLFKSIFALNAVLVVASCAPKATQAPEANKLPMPSAQAVARIASLSSPYNSGNVSNGRVYFGECAPCHTLDRNGSETKGPNLHGVFQRHAAASEHYPYSEALRNSNIVWDVQHLDQWLFNPHETLPGTTMAFIGVRDNAKRRDLLAYLIAISSDTELASSP